MNEVLRIIHVDSLLYDSRHDFVGAGRFSEVFRAVTPDGEQVAVKKVNTRIRRLDDPM
jgi:hypothetical protein